MSAVDPRPAPSRALAPLRCGHGTRAARGRRESRARSASSRSPGRGSRRSATAHRVPVSHWPSSAASLTGCVRATMRALKSPLSDLQRRRDRSDREADREPAPVVIVAPSAQQPERVHRGDRRSRSPTNAASTMWSGLGGNAPVEHGGHRIDVDEPCPSRARKPAGVFIQAFAATTKTAESTPATATGTPVSQCAARRQRVPSRRGRARGRSPRGRTRSPRARTACR